MGWAIKALTGILIVNLIKFPRTGGQPGEACSQDDGLAERMKQTHGV
jgi:hypothetical protein